MGLQLHIIFIDNKFIISKKYVKADDLNKDAKNIFTHKSQKTR